MARSFINKSFNRNGKKANTSLNVSANNNTIYEEEESHLMNSTVCGAPFKSPLSKFCRYRSDPLPNAVTTCTSPIQETSKKTEDSRQQKSFGKFLRYIRPNARKKKASSNDVGSLKQNELNASLVSDEIEPPSIESPLQNIPSQAYEQSVNKHGEVVEYAVPYSEQILTEFKSPIKSNNESGSRSFEHCEDVVDENVLNESKWNDRVEDLIESSVTSPQRPSVKVTDLDKSSDGSRSLDHSGMFVEN